MPADNAVAAIVIGTLAMLAAGEAIAPGFASVRQISGQLTVAAILGIVAAGQGLVILSGREGIDLSVASVMSLAALTAGNVMGGDNALTLSALAASLAIGVSVGLFNGLGVAMLRIPPLVMTLGTAGVITGLLVVLTQGQTSGAGALMDVSLTGMVVLVTGGSQGVGEGIARLAAGSGAAGLVLTGRDAARGRTVADGLGVPAVFVSADLADPESPGRVAGVALARFGRIDGLVNAAGLTDRGSVLTGDVALWDRLFAVNARAPFLLMQAALRDMAARGAVGCIVNILSMNAYRGTSELAVCTAIKGALATLTKNAAHAHLAGGIRVNGIMMGWAVSPAEERMQAETLGKGADWAAKVAAGMPLKRLLSVDEVARLAVFLLSPAQGLMTGALIDIEQKVVGA